MGEQGPIEAEQPVTADPSSEGPMGYVRAAVKVAQMDTETIARLSRDPKALLISMVTFQEVDGIERLQALGLSLGLGAGLYALGALLAR